jgi:TonB family protein
MFGGPPPPRGTVFYRTLMLIAFATTVISMIALMFGYRLNTGPSSGNWPLYTPPKPTVGPAAAKARSDETQWITSDDYPPEAIRANQQGTVTISWTIGVDGRVRDCHSIGSSGFATLDEAGCRALTRRGRYAPARDAIGKPLATKKTRRIAWRLPKE